MAVTINGSGTITGASTLATTVASPTLTTPNIDSAQFATVSGTAPLYACRAWVNFNGTGTVAIRASGNCSSVSDLGVGDYQINFATAMPDANYNAVIGISTASGTTVIAQVASNGSGTIVAPTSSALRVASLRRSDATAADVDYSMISIFR
jgi:hypothetical protein